MYAVGPFLFDSFRNRLTRAGRDIPLSPKAAQILSILLINHGKLVEKEHLLREIWPDVFVEEGNIAHYISELRAVFRTEDGGRRWILAVSKRGYRFVGPCKAMAVADARDGIEKPEFPPDYLAPATVLGAASGAGAEIDLVGAAILAAPSRRMRRLIRLAAAAMFLLIAGPVTERAIDSRRPRVVKAGDLTHGLSLKGTGLVAAAGRHVYYSQRWPVGTYSVAAEGGESAPVNALRTFTPTSLSPDGVKFLALKEGTEPPEIWLVPVSGGEPHRVGNLHGDWPAWSPDGNAIAFCDSEELCIADAEGAGIRTIASVPGRVLEPTWSPDGTAIRFMVGKGESSAIWQVRRDGTNLHKVVSRWENDQHEAGGQWTADGRYFVFIHREDGHGYLWARQEKCGLFRWECGRLFQLTTGPEDYVRPLPSSDGKRIYCIGTREVAQVRRFDAAARSFVPYAPIAETPAVELDFSRDEKWIAYRSLVDHSIWKCRRDGSEKQQLTFPPTIADNPHWSPDGKQIAFLDETGGGFKACVVPAGGGAITTLVPGRSKEGVPTWSPEGNQVVWGEPIGFRPNSEVRLHVFDFGTRQVSELDGSERSWTPRWSPDGRYVVAMELASENGSFTSKLRLFDGARKQWSTLTEATNIIEPVWSPDSRYVYFAALNSDSAIYRVRIADHHRETVVRVDPAAITRGAWIGIAPDGSVLVSESKTIQEVEALEVEWP